MAEGMHGWAVHLRDKPRVVRRVITTLPVRALRVFKVTTKVNVFPEVRAQARPSRCFRRSGEWLRSGNVSSAIIIRSSSIIGVCDIRSRHSTRTNHICPDVSGVKSDRSMSPNPMSEEDRRDLIARQHRALYGDAASLYGAEAASSRPQSQDVVRGSHSGRGASPLAFDPYANQGPSSEEGAVQMPPRGDHLNTTTSPLSNTTTQQSFGLMSAGAQQSSRTSASSPGTSPPPGQGAKGNATGVAPIGTRPLPGSASAGSGVNQRATTPLTSSSLGFNSNNNNSAGSANPKDERSTSAASNPASTLAESGANPTAISKGVSGLGAWGGAGNANVWGSGKNTLAVQPSVWG